MAALASSSLLYAACDWDSLDPRLAETGGGGTSEGGSGAQGGQGGQGGGQGGNEGGGGSVDPGDCGAVDLASDDFDDGMTDAARWLVGQSSGGSVDESTGALVMGAGLSTSSSAVYITRGFMKLVGRSISVEAVAVPTMTPARMDFEALLNDSNRYIMRFQNGNLEVHRVVVGFATKMFEVPYDANAHRYWQMSATEDDITFEASADGSAWNALTTIDYTQGFVPEQVQVRLELDGESSMVTDSATFDNLQGTGPGTGTWCPIATEKKGFSSAEIDPHWFAHSFDSNSTAIITDGVLYLTPSFGENTGYNYRSSAFFDLQASTATVELQQALTIPGRTSFRLHKSNGYLTFDIIGDPDPMGDPNDPVLAIAHRIDGTTVDVASVPYDATAHRWLRFREEGDTLYWEASPDGSAWDSVGLVSPVPFDIDALRMSLEAITDEMNPDPGQAILDNINNAPD